MSEGVVGRSPFQPVPEAANDETANVRISLPRAIGAMERLFLRGDVTLLNVKIALAELAPDASSSYRASCRCWNSNGMDVGMKVGHCGKA